MILLIALLQEFFGWLGQVNMSQLGSDQSLLPFKANLQFCFIKFGIRNHACIGLLFGPKRPLWTKTRREYWQSKITVLSMVQSILSPTIIPKIKTP